MRLKEFSRSLSIYLFYFSFILCIPLILAAFYEFLIPESHPQPHTTLSFLSSLAFTLSLAFFFRFLGRKATGIIYRRESIFLVVLIWLITAFLSALPFIFSRTLSPLDAYFEAMSGLTTTGATMLCGKAIHPTTGQETPIRITNPHVPEKTYIYYGTVSPVRDPVSNLPLHTGIEAVSKALLFWRSLLQWIGGLGIVVIFLTVLPALGVGGKFLYQMELTGPIKDEISPKISDIASRLWKFYLFFTLLEVFLLSATNSQMPLFDAVCISLSNVSTGGFTVRNGGINSYHSLATEGIIAAFMIVGSLNFLFYSQLIQKKFPRAFIPELLLFLGIALVGSLLISLFLIPTYPLSTAFRLGIFQAIASQTSTGFYTTKYDLWPFAPQMFMLLLFFVGGMSGSTTGGIKTSRFYIAYKILIHRLESIFRPDTVRKLYIRNSEIDDKNALTVLSFFCIVFSFTILGAILFILDGIDPETSLGITSGLVNNVGLFFRAASPPETLAFLSPFSKVCSIFWMLLGRLEYYVVLLLFLPNFWKNR
jgi:trk system potassium uptake protein